MVTGFFDLRDLGPSQVKGAAEPLRLFELVGVGRLRTRFDAAGPVIRAGRTTATAGDLGNIR